MSPYLLVTLVVTALMAKTLTDITFGGRYRCPSCGARTEDDHSDSCSWRH
jgi:hypothetical protein